MIIDEYGNRRFYGLYRGVVVDNRDPLGKGRIRLRVPQVLFNSTTDWAWAQQAHGVQADPPAAGKNVWVMFEGGDPSFPVWVGTFNDTSILNLALNDLSDVNTAGVTDGQVIKYQASTQTWILGTGGGTLNDLTDVTVTSPATGQTIKYDAATSSWVNGTVSGLPAGGTAGQILTKIDSVEGNATWMDNYADWTSQVKQYVRAAEILTKGQAVYVSSSDGTNIMVSKASNTTEALSSKTIGLIAQDLNTTSNKFGYVITEGLLGGLNTSSGEEGDPVWLGVSGALIYGLTNKPIAPAHLVYIGVITKKSSGSGEIFIKPQNGFELQELHNVLIGTNYSSTPADNNLLAYDSASGLWKNQTGSQANLVTLSDSGTVTNSMLANSTITFGSTSQALGSTVSNLAGVTINSTTIPSSATLLTGSDVGSTVQAYDADLGAIGALAGTAGLLKKTAANTWSLDTSTYLTNDLVGFPGTITGAIYTSTVAPTVSIKAGDHWLDPDTGNLFVYYDDGTSSQWVQTSSGLSGGTDIRGRVGSLESRTTDVETLNTTQDGRLTAVEGVNTTQDSRLTAVEGVNTTQNGRLTSLEGYSQQSPNFIINGAFDIWQRGTSSTTVSTLIADRWYHAWSAGTATVSRSTDVPATTLQYSLSHASTSGTNPAIYQRIEAANAIPLVGQTVTFSIWAKSTVGTAGLNWTTFFPTTTVDTFGAITQDQSGTFAATMTVGTWTRYSATFTVAAGAVRGYGVNVFRSVTTTNTTTLYAGAQLEVGSVATPFRRNAPSIQAELAACQRYYYRVTADGVYTGFGIGQAWSTTQARVNIPFPVTMRAAPGAPETTGTASNYAYSAAGQGTSSTISTSVLNSRFSGMIETTGTFTAGAAVHLIANNTTAAYIGFSAEL